MKKRSYPARNLILGEGRPKICVPVCAGSLPEALEAADHIAASVADLMEWRLDALSSLPDVSQWEDWMKTVRQHLGEKALLVTYRTRAEGGMATWDEKDLLDWYPCLYEEILKTGEADFIDIQYRLEEAVVRSLIKEARDHHVWTILSGHDFQKTPSGEEILEEYERMADLGGDVLKLAVMPVNQADVITMKEAARQAYASQERPIIAISMGELGVDSRIHCQEWGSVLTFGTLGQASAPGQIPVEELYHSFLKG
jgi:3-dehydroquinate dehydratase-1